MTPTQLRRLATVEHLLFAAFLAVLADQCSRSPLLRRWEANAALRRLERLGVWDEANR